MKELQHPLHLPPHVLHQILVPDHQHRPSPSSTFPPHHHPIQGPPPAPGVVGDEVPPGGVPQEALGAAGGHVGEARSVAGRGVLGVEEAVPFRDQGVERVADDEDDPVKRDLVLRRSTAVGLSYHRLFVCLRVY